MLARISASCSGVHCPSGSAPDCTSSSSRNRSTTSFWNCRRSSPSSRTAPIVASPIAKSPCSACSASCVARSSAISPSPSRTASSDTSLPYESQICSSRLIASRRLPVALRPISSNPSRGTSSFSSDAMCASRSAIADSGMRLNSNRWHRDTIVAGTLCVSVVARMKTMCSGGSSRIFSNALNACSVSMCTSSMRYTLCAAAPPIGM